MDNVFLAFSFGDEDRDLVALADRVLAAHDVSIIRGERLGGADVTEEVKRRIGAADGLVALLTRREEIVGGGWRSRPWATSEITTARALDKPAIALVEEGVEVAGAYSENERIYLDRNNPLEALLRLSETIGLWRREAGRIVKAKILPDHLVQQLSLGDEGVQCNFRFRIKGDKADWKKVEITPEPGGTFVYLYKVHDDYNIELELRDRGKSWMSRACPQYVSIELEEVK